MCVGLGYIAKAGVLKEADDTKSALEATTTEPPLSDLEKPEPLYEGDLEKEESLLAQEKEKPTGRDFGRGLALCIFSGLMCSMANLAFALEEGTKIKEATLAHGASVSNQANVLWALVLIPVGVVNFAWYGYTVFKDGTFKRFFADDASTVSLNVFAAAMMGLLWFGGTVLSGVGEIGIGNLGAVIGWPVYTTSMVLTSNLVGIIQGEWSQAGTGACVWMGAGLLIMITAVFIVGMYNTFTSIFVGVPLAAVVTIVAPIAVLRFA